MEALFADLMADVLHEMSSLKAVIKSEKMSAANIWLCFKDKLNIRMFLQGSHRLEKYLNIQDCFEKSLKMRFSLKST